MATRRENDLRQLFEAVGTLVGGRREAEGLLVLLPVGQGGQVWCEFVPRKTVAGSLARSVETAMRLLGRTPERMRAVYFGSRQVLLATEAAAKTRGH